MLAGARNIWLLGSATAKRSIPRFEKPAGNDSLGHAYTTPRLPRVGSSPSNVHLDNHCAPSDDGCFSLCVGAKPSQVSSRSGYLALLVQCYALAQDTQVPPCLSYLTSPHLGGAMDGIMLGRDNDYQSVTGKDLLVIGLEVCSRIIEADL